MNKHMKNVEEIQRAAVLGAGTMGHGIAQVLAMAGIEARMYDVSDEFLERGLGRLRANLDKGVDKGKVTPEQRDAVLGRLVAAPDLDAAAGESDLIVEAAPESLELKRQIFARIDAAAPAHAILASNTSSLPITKIAEATQRPDKVLGMHFFNPVPIMKLVEVIRGLATSEETTQRTLDLARAMGKSPVPANDRAGFVSNRVLMPMINEAIYTLYEGVGSVQGIDTAMKLGTRHPMGPLELADFIGLDVCLAIMNMLHEGLADTKYRPCPLLVKYVEAGWLGRKTNRGFYDYRSDPPVPTR